MECYAHFTYIVYHAYDIMFSCRNLLLFSILFLFLIIFVHHILDVVISFDTDFIVN